MFRKMLSAAKILSRPILCDKSRLPAKTRSDFIQNYISSEINITKALLLGV